jgi:hypothetical protein
MARKFAQGASGTGCLNPHLRRKRSSEASDFDRETNTLKPTPSATKITFLQLAKNTPSVEIITSTQPRKFI